MYNTTNKYIRDEKTGALVNTDNEAYDTFKSERDKVRKIMEVEAQVGNLKTELSEIKGLLLKLVNGNNNV